MGVVGCGFALATTVSVAFAVDRGGRALKLSALLLLASWIASVTYGSVAEAHEKLQTYAWIDATVAGVLSGLLVERRQPWRFALFGMLLVQLILHTEFAYLWDFSLKARRQYILTLNVSYAIELLILTWGAVVYRVEEDDMPALPETIDTWREIVDKPSPFP